MGQRKSAILTEGRRLHDLGRVVAEATLDAGGTDNDIVRVIGMEGLQRQIGLLVMGKLLLARRPSERLAADLIPADWEVVEDVEPSVTDVAKLRPVPILKDGESCIGGDEMRKRAVVSKGNLGLADGKLIIAEQANLSADFNGFLIPLPGTVLRDPHGRLYVAYLYQDGGRWYVNFDRLGDDWDAYGRFARSE